MAGYLGAVRGCARLDELVLQLRECMTEKGLPAILRLILELVDESLAPLPLK